MTTTAPPEDKRALAQRARLARAARIVQLRRRVVATALATFVLATGIVAWDGSMGGTPAASSTAASGSVLVEQSVESDTADGWSDIPEPADASSPEDSSSAADVVTTQQS